MSDGASFLLVETNAAILALAEIDLADERECIVELHSWGADKAEIACPRTLAAIIERARELRVGSRSWGDVS